MKNRFRIITKRILILVLTLFVILIISFFRYDIFLRQELEVNRKLRLLEMYNSIFHPFFRNGVVNSYYDSNELAGELYYEKGKLVKKLSYYENGEINSETPIKYCSNHGTVRHFYENGNIKFEVEYAFGIKNGKAKEYSLTGHVLKEIDFKNNLRHGNYFEYDSTGTVIFHEKYESGEKVE